MLSVKVFGRNYRNIFSNTTIFHPAYSRIYGNQKPRNKHSPYYIGRKSLPRMIAKYEFVYAQNRAYSRQRILNKRAFLRALSKNRGL